VQDETYSTILHRAPSALSLTIPVSDERSVIVDIQLSPLWEGSLQIKTQDGEMHQAPLILCYRGKIRGIEKSVAALTFSEESIVAVISDSTGNYVLSPLKSTSNIGAKKYCIYNDRDLKILQGFSCGTAEPDSSYNAAHTKAQKQKGNKLQTGACQIVKVAPECEFEVYQAFGNSLSRTAEYIVSMFNVVGAIYKNENINLFIKDEIFIWTTTDPYNIKYNDPGDPNMEATLNQFVDYRDPYSGNIAYLFRQAPSG